MTSCLLQQSTFSNCQTLYHQVSSLGQFSPTSIKDMPITCNVNNRGLIGSDSYPSMCLQHWHYDWLNDLLITITVSLLLFFCLVFIFSLSSSSSCSFLSLKEKTAVLRRNMMLSLGGYTANSKNYILLRMISHAVDSG